MGTSMTTDAVLHHLTLLTGDLRRSPLSEVRDDTIDGLLPLVDADGGELPVPDWHLDILHRVERGGALFQIGPRRGSKNPWVLCGVAWDAESAGAVWDQVTTANRLLCRSMLPVGWREPGRPPLPWLAVVITPFSALLQPDAVGMLGDAERCIAWAIIEGTQGPC